MRVEETFSESPTNGALMTFWSNQRQQILKSAGAVHWVVAGLNGERARPWHETIHSSKQEIRQTRHRTAELSLSTPRLRLSLRAIGIVFSWRKRLTKRARYRKSGSATVAAGSGERPFARHPTTNQ